MRVTAPALAGMIASGMHAVRELVPGSIHEVTLHGSAAVVYIQTSEAIYRVRVEELDVRPVPPPYEGASDA